MRPLCGLVVVDKPAGRTSAHVVDRIRKLTGLAKVGHTGTLDPLATGVLPICLGEATKLAGLLIAEHKRYRAELRLGQATDTQDRLGQVVAEAPQALVDSVRDSDIEAARVAMLGKQQQLPPMFSAVKVQGKRLYERARLGITIERPVRDIEIFACDVVRRQGAVLELDVHCSKGTFIRTVVDDLGRRLGVFAHLTELRRSQTGKFQLGHALDETRWTVSDFASSLIPMTEMTDLPVLTVEDDLVPKLKVGNPAVLTHPSLTQLTETNTLLADTHGAVWAIARREAARVRYERVFVYDA